METSAIIFVTSFLSILLNAAHVESMPHWYSHQYSFFVFGDSYADTGNFPKSYALGPASRQWYTPYGVSNRPGGNGEPSGRFSDGSLETDFIALMLGHVDPPPTCGDRSNGDGSWTGMNFAHGGAGVYKAPTLSKQIRHFEKVQQEMPWNLRASVALVAISGNDYERTACSTSSAEEMTAIIGNVTTEIANGVKRLRRMGVPKVLVNNLHPAGCTPRQTRTLNYTSCDGSGNTVADFHNRELNSKLSASISSGRVYVVDLNRAFSSIINPQDPSASRAKQFTEKLMPCCRSFDPNGYCGQVDDEDDEPQYSVCKNPEQHFFWDDMHPSQAGWNAVMGQLESGIDDFLRKN